MMNQDLLNIKIHHRGINKAIRKDDNPEVLTYFDAMGLEGSKLKDETAWCSAFMNWVAIKSGAEHTCMLNARSWLKVGQSIDVPKLGDVVDFWRESKQSWKGHVALFICQRNGFVYCLGGNQSNKVGVNAYRVSRVLSYQRL